VFLTRERERFVFTNVSFISLRMCSALHHISDINKTVLGESHNMMSGLSQSEDKKIIKIYFV